MEHTPQVTITNPTTASIELDNRTIFHDDFSIINPNGLPLLSGKENTLFLFIYPNKMEDVQRIVQPGFSLRIEVTTRHEAQLPIRLLCINIFNFSLISAPIFISNNKKTDFTKNLRRNDNQIEYDGIKENDYRKREVQILTRNHENHEFDYLPRVLQQDIVPYHPDQHHSDEGLYDDQNNDFDDDEYNS